MTQLPSILGNTPSPQLPAGYSMRPIVPGDEPLIAYHRAVMFRDIGFWKVDTVESLAASSLPWFRQLMASGAYVGWFILYEGQVVAGGGIMLRVLPPVPGSTHNARWGHIVNMYTEPGHRRRGLARIILNQLVAFAKAQKLDRLSLHAADDARPLYASAGFTATNEMELKGVGSGCCPPPKDKSDDSEN